MKKYEYILLGVLFLYGFVLRIYNLGFQSLWIDESFSINASLAILKHFYPLLDSGFVYSGYLLHTYLLSGMFFLFGVSEFAARLPSVVFGSLFIVLVYLFVRYLFNARVALLSSILVAFSTLEIAWSRQARSYIMLQFFFFLSLFLFLYFVRSKELKYFYYSLLAAFVSFFVHPFALFLFVVYFVYIVVNFRFFSEIFSKKLLLVSVVCILVVGFLFALQFRLFSFVDYVGYYFGFLRSEFFAAFYFAVLGALFSIRKFREPFLLVLAFVIPFFTVSFFVYLIHFRYVFLILPVLFIFCAYFIDFFSSYLKKFAIPVALFLLFVSLFSTSTFIPQKSYELERLTPQPDYKSAYDYLAKNVNSSDIIISSHPTVTSFYLRKPDFALEYSLSGKPEDSVRFKNESFERYQAVQIADYDKLIDITKNNNGYIIIDSLATNTIQPEIISLAASLQLVEEASAGDRVSLVNVYKF